MPQLSEFEHYINQLCEALGHRDRHRGFVDYSRGLMLPLERKSVEPLSAHTDPPHVGAKRLSLATERRSVAMVWRLWWPEKGAKDRRRRKKGGVPEELKFQIKRQIALEQSREAKPAGVGIGMVPADAGYGNQTAWREALEG